MTAHQLQLLAVPGLGPWRLSSSSDPHALSIVDGTGRFAAHGPHYSRRTPGSATFTGVGREVVLVTDDAVWAVVLARPPQGGGAPIWRNNLFRNLGPALSSDLIRSAVEATRLVWLARYGELPSVPLRTEVDAAAVRSTNPGYCYLRAGWTRHGGRRSLVYLYAPDGPPTPHRGRRRSRGVLMSDAADRAAAVTAVLGAVYGDHPRLVQRTAATLGYRVSVCARCERRGVVAGEDCSACGGQGWTIRAEGGGQ